MTGRTSQNVPYANASDALVDYPPVSQEVAGLVRLAPAAIGNVLPPGTFDGQELLLDLTPGGGARTLWRVRWSVSLARWAFIGGSPMFARNDGAFSTVTTWSPVSGISMVVPTPGRYSCRWGAETGFNAGTYVTVGVIGPGVAITDYNPPQVQSAASAGYAQVGTQREFVFTGAGPVGTISMVASSSVAGMTMQRVFLEVRPVYLGGA